MICKALPSDRTALRAMFSEFYASDAVLHSLPESYHDAALDELFRTGSMQRAYLLEANGNAAGYALLSLKYSHEAGGMELWLEELFVRPAYRGHGLGTEFFDFLLPQARAEDIRRIRLEIEPDNSRAAALYQRFGFTPLGYAQLAWTL